MKLSKARRERIAELCSALASPANDGDDGDMIAWTYGCTNLEMRVALKAQLATNQPRVPGLHLQWADAEAMIRTGWSPS